MIFNAALSVLYEDLISLEQIVLAVGLKEYDDEHHTLTITLMLGCESSVQTNMLQKVDNRLDKTSLTCYNDQVYPGIAQLVARVVGSAAPPIHERSKRSPEGLGTRAFVGFDWSAETEQKSALTTGITTDSRIFELNIRVWRSW